jgi:hypothetical protein
MKTAARIALTCVLISAPGWASAWWAWTRHEVFPVAEGVFEVVSEPGSGPQDFWCGAGDYAIRVLGVKVVQRIYTWRGIGPSVARPGRKAMQFAFAPPKGADTSTSLSLSLTRVGDNLTAAAARQYCYGNNDLWDRWLF